MSIQTVEYIEIPVYVSGNYIPEEKPDYSDISPCEGSPEEVDFVRVEIPGIPDAEKFINHHEPDFWARAAEKIIAKAKDEKEQAAERQIDAIELQQKYGKTG